MNDAGEGTTMSRVGGRDAPVMQSKLVENDSLASWGHNRLSEGKPAASLTDKLQVCILVCILAFLFCIRIPTHHCAESAQSSHL